MIQHNLYSERYKKSLMVVDMPKGSYRNLNFKQKKMQN